MKTINEHRTTRAEILGSKPFNTYDLYETLFPKTAILQWILQEIKSIEKQIQTDFTKGELYALQALIDDLTRGIPQ